MKNKSYIGISFIILIFGIIFIPRIIERIKKDDIVRNDRMSLSNEINKEEAKSSLVIMGKAPSFKLTDQNNQTITEADYKGLS